MFAKKKVRNLNFVDAIYIFFCLLLEVNDITGHCTAISNHQKEPMAKCI